jgi:DNA helicase MCM9
MVGKDIDVRLSILASSVRQITKMIDEPVEDPIEIPEDDFALRATLIQSTAKHLTGLQSVKLGLLLTLLGGVDNPERKTRNLFHMLMIGEECTGKSELLKEATALTEKSKLLNSVGVSKAGLSMGAVKEGKDWVVEAGALVLTDQGLCCIDDIDKLSKDCF